MADYVKGLVSVIMPTYRRSEKLTRAIKSVLCQTYTQLELLLVNDNEPSDDFTKGLLTRIKPFLNDPRFELIMQEKHINGAAARNVGIRKAKGEYIAFLDDDDWWDENKLQIQVETLNKLPKEWGGVSCKIKYYDKNDQLIGKSKKYKDGYIYKDILNLQTDVATGTICLRHKDLDETGYFDESLLRHQDLQLLVFFTSKYKLKEIDSYLHYCDVSDLQNRPDGKKLIVHKQRFFNSISPVLASMKKREIRCAKAMHKFEVGYVFFKNREILQGIKYSIAIFSSPKTFYYAIKKMIQRIQQYRGK